MGKHTKKKHRRKNRQRCDGKGVVDMHHLCYTKRTWSRGNLLKLRDFWYCRVRIPRDTVHKAIHLEVPEIPPPKDGNAKDALKQLEFLEKYGSITEFDSIERRLDLLTSLFDCCDQPTADAFRAQLDVVHKFKKVPR